MYRSPLPIGDRNVSVSLVIRRLGLAPAVFAATTLLAIAGLSSCDKYKPNETAAAVNGHELSLNQLTALAAGNDDPTVLRATLTAWIQVVAASQDPGEFLTEDALSAQRSIIIPPLIESTQGETRAQYEKGLGGSPLLCMAVIPLAAGVASAEVLAALDSGTPFADLATEFSQDPTLADSGGIIKVNGEECLPTDQWNADLIGLLTDAEAKVGKPDVIILNNAEVVVLLRPFDELSDNSKILLAQGPVSEALLKLYQAADVKVNESIGTWDSGQGLVVAPPSDA